MTNSAEEFEKKHDIAATRQDVTRIKGQLRSFYKAVEKIDRPRMGYIQLYNGGAVRQALSNAFADGLQATANDVAMALSQMPERWTSKYRASVAYHLSPIMDEVINS